MKNQTVLSLPALMDRIFNQLTPSVRVSKAELIQTLHHTVNTFGDFSKMHAKVSDEATALREQLASTQQELAEQKAAYARVSETCQKSQDNELYAREQELSLRRVLTNRDATINQLEVHTCLCEERIGQLKEALAEQAIDLALARAKWRRRRFEGSSRG